MWNGSPELQQYVTLAADQHQRFLHDAAVQRLLAGSHEARHDIWRFIRQPLASLRARLRATGQRPARRASAHSSIEPSV